MLPSPPGMGLVTPPLGAGHEAAGGQSSRQRWADPCDGQLLQRPGVGARRGRGRAGAAAAEDAGQQGCPQAQGAAPPAGPPLSSPQASDVRCRPARCLCFSRGHCAPRASAPSWLAYLRSLAPHVRVRGWRGPAPRGSHGGPWAGSRLRSGNPPEKQVSRPRPAALGPGGRGERAKAYSVRVHGAAVNSGFPGEVGGRVQPPPPGPEQLSPTSAPRQWACARLAKGPTALTPPENPQTAP